MVETTNQIEQRIEKSRDDLGTHLQELETKVKNLTDWKHHFKNSPLTYLGIAFGGGVLVAAAVGGRGSSAPRSVSAPSPRKEKALKVLDHVQDALLGVAATHVTDFVSDLIPGFRDQLARVREKV